MYPLRSTIKASSKSSRRWLPPPRRKNPIDARAHALGVALRVDPLLTLAQTRLQKPYARDPGARRYCDLLGPHPVFSLRRRALRHQWQGSARAVTEDLNVLLPVTPIANTEDIHGVVEKIQHKAQACLSGHFISSRVRQCASRWRCRRSVRTSSSTPGGRMGRRPLLSLAETARQESRRNLR